MNYSIGTARSIKQAQSIVGTSPGRPEHDFYPTPPEMTQVLLDNYSFYNEVWEPACGDGAMSKVLLANNYNVFSSDLIRRGYGFEIDFLLAHTMPLFTKAIITNPPYTLAEKFVEHAHKIGCKQLALLCKLTFLEGQARKFMFAKYPLARVLVFSKRQTMTRNGEPSRNGGMIAYAWFIWDSAHSGNDEPTIGWI